VAKKLKEPADILRGILSESPGWRQYEATRERHSALEGELRGLQARVQELLVADLEGVQTLVQGGRTLVDVGTGNWIPVEKWRSDRQRERAAVATLDGREMAASERDGHLHESEQACSRIAEIETALPVSERRVVEAFAVAKRELRPQLQRMYGERIARLVPILEALGELATEAVVFTDELRRYDLDVIRGLALSAYEGRRKGSKLDILLAQAREIAAS